MRFKLQVNTVIFSPSSCILSHTLCAVCLRWVCVSMAVGRQTTAPATVSAVAAAAAAGTAAGLVEQGSLPQRILLLSSFTLLFPLSLVFQRPHFSMEPLACPDHSCFILTPALWTVACGWSWNGAQLFLLYFINLCFTSRVSAFLSYCHCFSTVSMSVVLLLCGCDVYMWRLLAIQLNELIPVPSYNIWVFSPNPKL